MSKFFIDRPVFAWVVAISIMLGGVLSIYNLPITQYPDVAPPAIMVSGFYPGSSPQNTRDTVVQVIEQHMTGLDGFRYMSSSTTATGNFDLIITFNKGVDPDIAQVQVQNKLQLALPMLPMEVQAQGVSVTKHQKSFMLILTLYSEDGSIAYDELADYLVSHVKEPIARTEGVGEVLVWASQYAMRIWLDPEALYQYRLVPADVVAAVESQNIQISAGQLGALPTRKGVELNASVISKSRFSTAEQFENILVKVNRDGSQVRLKDVAEVALGSESYSYTNTFNARPGATMAVRLAPDGNILEATRAVKETVSGLSPQLPPSTQIAFSNEIAPVVEGSIRAIVITLLEAIALVSLVMWLFLQNIRTTLITTLTIPVVMLGTFIILAAFGMTINIITLFALILTIGLLVDDAIVVVENVERLITEEGLPPVEATRKSMEQLQGALVGIGLVISAVFFPMAFFSGSTGVIYRQFSVTIIGAMSLSVFVALTFTPALCAMLLKGHGEKKSVSAFFNGFNTFFQKMTRRYTAVVSHSLDSKKRYLLIFCCVVALIVFLYPRLQTAFLPNEDQGLMTCMIELPPNSSIERTQAIVAEIANYFKEEEGDTVYSVVGVSGYSYSGQGQNVGTTWLTLHPFKDRKEGYKSVFALADRASAKFATIPDAKVQIIIPASITELGNAAGFNFFLQDRANKGHEALMNARAQLLGLAWQDPRIAAAWTYNLPDEPQYFIHMDDEKAHTGVSSLADINSAFSIAWGGVYVNDFIHNGRLKKVYVQGKDDSRIATTDFHRWHVRSTDGEMIPFSSFATGEWIMGPPKLVRFNSYPAIEYLGFGIPGISTGEAMSIMEEYVDQLPEGFRLSFTGLSYEELEAGSQVGALYTLSLLIVFLCLAALYESWTVPFSVLIIMPFGVLGAILSTAARGLPNDVYFQVGILTVMGLSAKNAILIVEFAHSLYTEQGVPLVEAVTRAARLRLRPIIMTSMAFILGVFPLALATGASSASQQSLGTSVVGGTIFATFLAVFFVPLLYAVIASLFKKKKSG